MMINTELQRKIETSGLHPNDLIEVVRIFEVLTDEKKTEVLDRWDTIVAEIRRHREEIEREKEILLVNAISDIERDLEAYNRSLVAKWTRWEMNSLKQNL